MSLLIAAACAPATESEPIVIGAVYPTGGGQGPGGIEEYQGLRVAADLVNRAGGVRGRDVRLRLEQADSSDQAPGAVDRLAARGIEIVAGSYGSTISRPAAERAADNRMLFWETGAVGEIGMAPGPGRRFFRVTPTGEVLGKAAVEFVRDQVGPLVAPGVSLRWSVVYVDDVYGRSVGTGAVEEIRRAGLTLARAIPYRLQGADYAAIAQEIGEAGTDVLVVSSYLDDAVALRRETVRQRIPLKASIGTSSSYCMREFGELMGDDAVGLFASDKPTGMAIDPGRLSPEASRTLTEGRDEYKRRFKDEMTAPALAGFAAGWALFHHALPKANGLDADSVAVAARALNLPDGSLPNGGGLRFGGTEGQSAGANIRAARVIWEWVRPKTRAIVWPPAFANEPIRAKALT
ncbi:MAG TPA: ABC transporter substrate-binding protein [Actinomycetota bacterium]|nr:ABC transporter substrate-binding protein [Actinomycetota bacterium]